MHLPFLNQERVNYKSLIKTVIKQLNLKNKCEHLLSGCGVQQQGYKGRQAGVQAVVG